MTRLALSALILCLVSCGLQLPAEQVANVVYEPQETTDFYPVQTTGNVYIREVVNDEVVGSLESGTYLWVVCDNSWCFVRGTVYKVFQGCTTYNPDGLGCLVK
jgi:hypothetical protein